MEFTDHHTFDAPIEKVWAMFRDPESHVQKFSGMGHREVKVVEHTDEGIAMTLVISRVVDVDLPGFARKVLKPTNTVVSTDRWEARPDGSYGGGFDVDVHGAPVVSHGTTRLTPAGERTDYEVTVSVEVKVPMIGGKIADWAKGDIQAQMKKEFAAGDAWLASH